MVSIDYPKVFNFLENHDLFSLTKVPLDFICSICGKVMVNVCYSPCFCQYCLKCIKKLLCEDVVTTKCPGGKRQCGNLNLDFNVHIKLDDRMNLRIATMEIKCPNDGCTVEDCIYKIIDHLRVCSGEFHRCPYFMVGCSCGRMKENELSDHLLVDVVKHANLFMDFILNMKNQIESIRENTNENIHTDTGNETVLKNLIETIDKQKETIEMLGERVQTLDSDAMELKTTIQQLRDEIERLKSELSRPSRGATSEPVSDQFVTKKEMEFLRKEMQRQEKGQLKWKDEVQHKIKSVEESMNVSNFFITSISEKQDDSKDKIKAFKREVEKMKDDMKRLNDMVSTFDRELKSVSSTSKMTADAVIKKTFEKEGVSQRIVSMEKEIDKQKENALEISDLKAKVDIMDVLINESLVKMRETDETLRKLMNILEEQTTCNEKIEELKEMLRKDDVMSEISENQHNQEGSFDPVSFEYYGEFLWKIENVSLKKEVAERGQDMNIISDPFFSHDKGYKFCLWLCPNGRGKYKGTYLFIGFAIMKGEFDDQLEWPCRRQIEISILQHNTGKKGLSWTYKLKTAPGKLKVRYSKPIYESNKVIGFPDVINWQDLRKSHRMYKNDSLFIKCRILPSAL